MKCRLIYHIATGGTIGSGMTEDARQVDKEAQAQNLGTLASIPHTNYKHVEVIMSGDSSEHPRNHLVDLAEKAVACGNEGHGMVIEHGTDTMNLAATTLALAGNEIWKYPVVFLGSMKGPDREDSDAPTNTLTAGYFAAFGNASGVLAVRPHGKIITSRHDTPGGSVDWHGRGIQQAPDAYFAQIDLEKLLRITSQFKHDYKISLDKNIANRIARLCEYLENPTSEQIRRACENVREAARANFSYSIEDFEKIIKYQRRVKDGTLDTADATVVGGRGMVPTMSILGLSKGRIQDLKKECEGASPSEVTKNIAQLIEVQEEKGRISGKIVQPFTLIDNIQKSYIRGKGYVNWHDIMFNYLNKTFGWSTEDIRSISEFWEKYSGKSNVEMDFDKIVSVDASSDPNWLYSAVNGSKPGGLIIKATGASGLRLEESKGENYQKVLSHCKEEGVPVILTSSSRGEITSFEYGPGLVVLQGDLTFFAGTMDSDLVLPRMALLNHESNKRFVDALVDSLELDGTDKKEFRRNMQRQLLSGTHYRMPYGDETPDRQRVEEMYGIETRVDLLAGLHVKKAILVSYLHESVKRKMSLSKNLPGVLKGN